MAAEGLGPMYVGVLTSALFIFAQAPSNDAHSNEVQPFLMEIAPYLNWREGLDQPFPKDPSDVGRLRQSVPSDDSAERPLPSEVNDIAPERSTFETKGFEFSQQSDSDWHLEVAENPLTDLAQISLFSAQLSGAVRAELRGSCVEDGVFAIKATTFDLDRNTTVRLEKSGDFHIMDYRYNDTIVQLMGGSQYYNEFQVAWIVRHDVAESMKDMINIFEAPPTVVSMAGLPPLFLDGMLWRVTAKVQTTHGLVFVEVPFLREEVRTAIQSCMSN